MTHNEMTIRANRGTYLAFFALAVVVAARLAVVVDLSQIPLFYDQVYYNLDAQRYLNGERFVPQWPPGLPLVLSSAYRIFGNSPLVGHLVIFLLGLLSLWLVYVLSLKSGFDHKAALAAMLLIALFPGSFYYNSVLVTQTPAAVLLLLLSLFLVMEQDKEKGSLALLGAASLVCGLLSLIRAGGVFLLPVLLFLAVYKRERKIHRLIAVSVPFFMLVGAWVYYLFTVSGELIFINTFNSYNLFLGNNQYTHLFRTWELLNKPELYQKAMALIPGLSGMGPKAQDAAYFHAALGYCMSRPDLFIVRFISRALCFFSFDTNAASTVLRLGLLPHGWAVLYMALDAAAEAAIILLIFISLVLIRFDRRLMVLWLVSLGYMSQSLLAFSHPSYHYPVLVLMAALAGKSLVAIKDNPTVAFRKITKTIAGVSVAAGFCIVQLLWFLSMSGRFGYLIK